MESRIYKGTEVKFLIELECEGFDITRDDFNVEVVRGSTSQVLQKADMPHDDDGYYLCFDTADFGTGVINAIITAYVPDTDFADGFRTEKVKDELITNYL